jgi:hypothetical protein
MRRLLASLAVVAAMGCATPGAPVATAWEHWCMEVEGTPKAADLETPGKEGWELATANFRPPVVSNGSSVGGGATQLCFKRPRK